jgi:hypothetical protein
VLAAVWSETIRKAQEVFLIDLVEHPHHDLLDHLVLHGGDAQRAHATIGFGNVDPPRRLRPVGALMNPLMQVHQAIFQVDFVLLPCRAINTCGSLTLQGVEALPQAIEGDKVQQGGEPRTSFPTCCHTHTEQRGRHVGPALSPGRGLLIGVPLG